jgi:hypothetical protein
MDSAAAVFQRFQADFPVTRRGIDTAKDAVVKGLFQKSFPPRLTGWRSEKWGVTASLVLPAFRAGYRHLYGSMAN